MSFKIEDKVGDGLTSFVIVPVGDCFSSQGGHIFRKKDSVSAVSLSTTCGVVSFARHEKVSRVKVTLTIESL